MSKVFISVRFIDEDGSTDDWRGTFDLMIGGVANTKGLVHRLSDLVMREFVRRGLIAPSEREMPKPPLMERKKPVYRTPTGKFASGGDAREETKEAS
jgi:hypothetical protein